jgi:dihydrodipicolinate synthase/N-acetylneuraminate lyase
VTRAAALFPGRVLELFHQLAERDSAAARRLVSELGLAERVLFRNVAFDSHREALASRGGAATPALWDGAALHAGIDAVRAALARLARE